MMNNLQLYKSRTPTDNVKVIQLLFYFHSCQIQSTTFCECVHDQYIFHLKDRDLVSSVP